MFVYNLQRKFQIKTVVTQNNTVTASVRTLYKEGLFHFKAHCKVYMCLENTF